MLVFYVYDFSPVCTDQMCELNEMEFLTFNDDAGVLGISGDGPYSHRRFISEHDLSYPLLSDPEKRIYEEFGLVETQENGRREARRGIVLLDSDRTVQYRWKAESNWDEWESGVLSEANNVIRELVASAE